MDLDQIELIRIEAQTAADKQQFNDENKAEAVTLLRDAKDIVAKISAL